MENSSFNSDTKINTINVCSETSIPFILVYNQVPGINSFKSAFKYEIIFSQTVYNDKVGEDNVGRFSEISYISFIKRHNSIVIDDV